MSNQRLSGRDLRRALRLGDEISPSNGETLVVDALDLRHVLTRHGLGGDPRGLLLRAVKVEGPLLDLSQSKLPSIHAINCTFDGSIDLSGAEIVGELNLSGSKILGATPEGYSLSMRSATVSGDLVISDTTQGFSPFQSRRAILLSGTQVAGQCRLRGAEILGNTGLTGFGVRADLLQTTGPLYMERISTQGAISIVSAKIGDQVNISGAQIEGLTLRDCSIQADSIATRGPFYAEDVRCSGALSLISCELGDLLSLKQSTLASGDSQGLSVIGLYSHIDGSILTEGLDSTGGHTWEGSHVAGTLDLTSLTLGGGASIDCTDARMGVLKIGTTLGPQHALRLDNVALGRLNISCPHSNLPNLDSITSWSIGSFVGTLCDDAGEMKEWLSRNRMGTQPWYEYAAFCERSGKSSSARFIRYSAIAQETRTARIERRYVSFAARMIYSMLTGYGFYPLRTVTWLFVVLVASISLSNALASQFVIPTSDSARSALANTYGGLSKVPNWVTDADCRSTDIGVRCLDPLAYGIDAAVPGVGLEQPWQPPPGAATYAFSMFRFLSWTLGALALAGLTGILRPRGP